LSTSLSFDANATINADYFIQNRLMQVFSQSQEDQIILLASDGELYGHHQPFRDKFLSYMLNGALHQAEVEYTSPGRWLKEHPAVQTVRIRERTSWSCEHGILRWSAECGCTPHSEWKRPLRAFMDAAAEVVDEAYLARTRDWLADPWQARDTYIRVVLGEESFESWQQGQTIRALQADESSQLQRLMKAQWERQRMYTSCGWFFEDFDRIEPRNNVQYAAHALALTESVCSGDCISRVAALLAPVRSASTAVNAAEIFNQAIRRFEEHA
jgi:hypothetical protein